MNRRLLYGHTDAVLAFVADRSPVERPEWRSVAAAVGILREDGGLIGGVVFSDWNREFSRCEISCAGVSSFIADTQMVRELGALAFGQLATFRLFARTSDRNWRANRALRSLGFRCEGVKTHFFGREHHARDWRLLRPEFEARWGPIELQKAA